MKYKETLTQKEVNKFKDFKAFNDGDTYKEDRRNAEAYAFASGGVVYSMVDGDDGKIYYLKGLHLVNRFGYCVVKK